MEKLLKDLGERIRDLRKAERLSQEALAERVGINPKYLGQIERAETAPSLNTLCKITTACGITMSELFAFGSSKEVIDSKERLISEIIGLIRGKNEKDLNVIRGVIKEILKGLG
ncbi:MAG: helix-turn-helix transcriptional regulator [Pseudomonadota bacterium]